MNLRPHSPPFAHESRGGFTMIELMIVIAIMAVVMAISIPSMYRSMNKDSMRKVTQDVLDVFAYARAQAIMTGETQELAVRAADRLIYVQPWANGPLSGEELADRVFEDMVTEAEGGTPPQGRVLFPESISVEFVGINFVPDLQEAESASVRFYSNGTTDEFTMVIRSDRNEWRKFDLDVATAIVNWEVLR